MRRTESEKDGVTGGRMDPVESCGDGVPSLRAVRRGDDTRRSPTE